MHSKNYYKYYLLASSMSLAKLFSQAYILITFMPWMISLMIRILSSVFLAVLFLNWENFLPIQLCNGTNAMIKAPPTKVAFPMLLQVRYMIIRNWSGAHHR